MRVEWVLVAAIAASACGSAPKSVEPPRLKAALKVESDGARRYQRGDFVLAERRFEEAARRFAGIDDEAGGLRNRLHLARTRLALGRADAALELLGSLPADSPRDIEALLLKGQALLALGRVAEAGQALAAAEPRCGKDCGQLPSLKILLARTALADGRATAARLHADAALELLANDEHGQETANAWRVLAAARLADLDPPGGAGGSKGRIGNRSPTGLAGEDSARLVADRRCPPREPAGQGFRGGRRGLPSLSTRPRYRECRGLV